MRTNPLPNRGRPSVAMFVLNDMRLDSRVQRSAATLARSGNDVTVHAVLTDGTRDRSVEETDGYRIIRTPMLMGATSRPKGAAAHGRRNLRGVWKEAAAAAYVSTRPVLGGALHFAANWHLRWNAWARRVEATVARADVWHAHDFNTLALAVRCAERLGGAVVYDSHEVFFEAGAMSKLPSPIKGHLVRIERGLAARANAILTVNESVADELGRRLERHDITVVRNCAEVPRRAQPGLRDAAGIAVDAPVVLYHGSITTGRGLEILLRSMLDRRLRGAHMVYMGYGPLLPQLKQMAHDSAAREFVHFLPPVPPADVTAWVSEADVAAMPIEPTTLNHRLSSPNKMFEAIAGGVPVVGPDFVEFRRLIRDDAAGPLGVLHTEHTSETVAGAIAAVLALPDGERAAMRRRCRAAAVRRWNWKIEQQHLLAVYSSLSATALRAGAPRTRPVIVNALSDSD